MPKPPNRKGDAVDDDRLLGSQPTVSSDESFRVRRRKRDTTEVGANNNDSSCVNDIAPIAAVEVNEEIRNTSVAATIPNSAIMNSVQTIAASYPDNYNNNDVSALLNYIDPTYDNQDYRNVNYTVAVSSQQPIDSTALDFLVSEAVNDISSGEGGQPIPYQDSYNMLLNIAAAAPNSAMHLSIANNGQPSLGIPQPYGAPIENAHAGDQYNNNVKVIANTNVNLHITDETEGNYPICPSSRNGSASTGQLTYTQMQSIGRSSLCK